MNTEIWTESGKRHTYRDTDIERHTYRDICRKIRVTYIQRYRQNEYSNTVTYIQKYI